MSTNVRNEVSKKNPYYISKHRMLELKHFCLQYEEWRKRYVMLTVLQGYGYGDKRSSYISDKTANVAMQAASLDKRMKMVEKCARDAGGDIWEWLFKGVTCGLSYPSLYSQGIPCGKDYYYERYRKFFWILDKIRE